MSLYSDPIAYAKENRIPVTWARKWCSHHLEVQKKIEKAAYCPECREPALEIEGGSYEEGYDDYVFCNNCEFTADVEKQFEPLQHWYDFDVILAMKCGLVDGLKEFGSLGNWFRFVRKEIEKLPEAIVATESTQ